MEKLFNNKNKTMKANYFYTLLALGMLSVGSAYGQEIAVATETAVNVIPDYKSNYKLFFALALLAGFLLAAIFILAGNIKSLLKSDFYRGKLMPGKDISKENKSNAKTTPLIILALITVFSANNSYALDFNSEYGRDGLPWLRVENADLILLLGLNALLLLAFFYLRRLFGDLLKDVGVAQEKKKVKTKSISKFNAIMTDAVPIEQEASIIMEDEYDGIRELDNNLPPWWVAMLIATMIFAVVYIFHYHIFRTGDLQIAEYTKDVEKADADIKEYRSKMSMNVDETNATVMISENDLSTGKSLFQNNCVVCHGEKGEGDIGPNLTDDYWLYTGDIKAIFKTIKNGTANGMPEHVSKLNPIQIQQVASYVWHFPNTKGKDPQGDKYEKEKL